MYTIQLSVRGEEALNKVGECFEWYTDNSEAGNAHFIVSWNESKWGIYYIVFFCYDDLLHFKLAWAELVNEDYKVNISLSGIGITSESIKEYVERNRPKIREVSCIRRRLC